jgi:hypothetical protein
MLLTPQALSNVTRWTCRRGGSGLTTSCWPSWKVSEYAELPGRTASANNRRLHGERSLLKRYDAIVLLSLGVGRLTRQGCDFCKRMEAAVRRLPERIEGPPKILLVALVARMRARSRRRNWRTRWARSRSCAGRGRTHGSQGNHVGMLRRGNPIQAI